MYLHLFSVFRGEFWVSVLQGESFLFTIGMRTAVMLCCVCVPVCVMRGGGGKILTHICVLGVHLEILDYSTSVFMKVLTRFLTCNPHSYMLPVESRGFFEGCIPALPRAPLGTGGPSLQQ